MVIFCHVRIKIKQFSHSLSPLDLTASSWKRSKLCQSHVAPILMSETTAIGLRLDVTKLCVQRCPARVVTRAPRFSHSMPLLKSLHWFRVRYRIILKLHLTSTFTNATGIFSFTAQFRKKKSGLFIIRSSASFHSHI